MTLNNLYLNFNTISHYRKTENKVFNEEFIWFIFGHQWERKIEKLLHCDIDCNIVVEIGRWINFFFWRLLINKKYSEYFQALIFISIIYLLAYRRSLRKLAAPCDIKQSLSIYKYHKFNERCVKVDK